jgi:hypothetical protein
MFSMQSQEALRVEGFDGQLKGHKFLVVGDETAWLRRFNIIESESLYKGRNILVIQEAVGRPSGYSLLSSIGVLRKRWDLIVRVKEGFEAQMLATYVANCPKPVRILWLCATTGCEIPRGLWQRWKDVTLIGGTSEEMTQITCEWDAVLFPHRCPQAIVEKFLSGRGTGLVALASRMKEHSEEIADSGAALAWSNLTSGGTGSIYWYDPTEGKVEEGYTKKEAGSVLEGISKWLSG